MEERPKTPSVVSFSCELVLYRHGVPATPTWHLAAPDRIEPLFHTFDGAERDSRTDSLEHVLVHVPLWSLPPASFPRESSTPPEAEPLFRAHHPPCQRPDGLLRASPSIS